MMITYTKNGHSKTNGQSKFEVSAPKKNVWVFYAAELFYFPILYKFTADLTYQQSLKGAIKLIKKAPKGSMTHPSLGTFLLPFY